MQERVNYFEGMGTDGNKWKATVTWERKEDPGDIAAKAKENLKLSEGQGVKGCQISDDLKVDTKKELAKIAGVSHDTIAKTEAEIDHQIEVDERWGSPAFKNSEYGTIQEMWDHLAYDGSYRSKRNLEEATNNYAQRIRQWEWSFPPRTWLYFTPLERSLSFNTKHCPWCHHTWEIRGDTHPVSCPSCHAYFAKKRVRAPAEGILEVRFKLPGEEPV